MTRFSIIIWFLFLCVPRLSSAQWQALNGPPGADVRSLERTPDGALYLVTNLLLFKSTNNADSWQKVNVATPDRLDLEGITTDAAGNLYGVNYSQFYKSTDKGINWTLVSTAGDFYGVYNVKVFGPDHYLAIYGWNGIYVSIDDGVSWSKIWNREPYDLKANAAGDLFITTSNETYDEGTIMRYSYPGASPQWDAANWVKVYSTPGNIGSHMRLLVDASSNIYASTYTDLILSPNNGTDWSSIKANITESVFIQAVWAQAPDGTVYLTNSYRAGINASLHLYSTTDQGSSWTIGSSPTDAYGSSATRFSFGSGSTIFLGSDGDGVFRSTDGGGTWQQKSSGLLYGMGYDVAVANDGRIIYLNNSLKKSYWTSTDEGATWNFVEIPDYFRNILKLSDGKMLLYSGGPVYQSADNGASFSKVDDTYVNAVTEDASGNLFGADYNNIYMSVDQGDNWTSLIGAITGLPANYYSYFIAVDASSSNLFVWLYDYDTETQKLYRIPVAGGVASSIAPGPWEAAGNSANINNVFFSEDRLYVSTYDAIYQSPDNGTSWNTIGFSGTRVFPINGGLCVSQNGAFFVTQDGGKSWNNSFLPNSRAIIWDVAPLADGFIAAASNSPALKFSGDLILPTNQLPPYIDFDWQPTDGPFGGVISNVISDNSQNSYALTGSDIFTTLTFSTWQKLPRSSNGWLYDGFIDRTENAIYALHYYALAKYSIDSDSWTTVNSENISCRYHMVKCANGNIVMTTGCSNPAIYVSTDGGVTFGTPKLTLTGEEADAIITTKNSVIFANLINYTTQTRRVIRSKDNGDTWQEIPSPFASNERLASDEAGNLYIWKPATLYRSSDDGDTWVNMSGNLFGYIEYGARPLITPSGALLLEGFDGSQGKYGIWKTVNDGASWTFIPQDFNTISLNLVGSRLVAGTDRGVFTSDDNGDTFTERSHGITIDGLNDLEMTSPSEMGVLTNDYSRAVYTTSNFNTWNYNADLTAYKFFRKPDGTLIAYGGQKLFSKGAEGAPWEKIGSIKNNQEIILNLATADGTLYFITTQNNKIKYSNDLDNWTDLAVSGLPASYTIYSLAVNQSGFVFLVLYSDDSNNYEAYEILYGAAIKLNQARTPRNLNYSYEDGKVLLYDGSGQIFETSDGSSWTNKSAPVGEHLFITEKDYYFISRNDGALWLSRNKGQTWQSVGMGSNLRFVDIVVNEYDGHAYAAINDQVVYKSGNIIIPAETTAPVLAALTPENNATGVMAGTTLRLVFDEVVNPVSGKKVRIVDLANPISPVEILDATEAARDGKTFTFTPHSPLAYEKTYFVVVDNGAFTDIFDNPFGGFTNNTTWRFTIQPQPDVTKPIITYSAVTPAFNKGNATKLQITVTDDTGGTGVNPSTIKLWYRGIMSSQAPLEAPLTLSGGNTYEVSVSDAWLDELGLEFRFEAADNAGNLQTSPAGETYYQGYVAFPPASSPSLPSSVLSFGGQRQNYRIFSIPYKLNSAQMASVFDELAGMTAKTDFRIVHYNTESDEFTDYPALSTISRGLGYWINVKNVTTITVENASTPENTKAVLATLPLKPGWNQIGNPYPFTISWNAVRSASGNADIGVLKSFNGTGWVEDDKINPFEGGFVLLNGTSPISVNIPFTAKTTSGRTKDETLDWNGGWMLPLTVSNSKFQSVGGIGMHADANVGFDHYDDAMPPKMFSLPEIAFQHSEHLLKHFSRDVVSPCDQFIWDFTVDGGDEEATLSWDVDRVKGLDRDVYLFDVPNQTLVDMSQKGAYQIAGGNYAFKLYYGINQQNIKPSKILLAKPYPNPFAGHSRIGFTLPENTAGTYAVSLEVYDQLGKKVATLAHGSFSAGFYSADWHPDPASVHSSVYLVRLFASDGKSSIALTEKIIVKK
jgi:photosystem II stability/assembly factor-like uncharacterized protein